MNLTIPGYFMEDIMRNYQVGILTGVSYILLIVACGCFREESFYETHEITKPVVIFEYLPSGKEEDDTFDEFKFVSGTVAGMEKIKAISRRNGIMVDETKTKTTPMLKPEITSKYSKNDKILLKAIAQLEAGNQGLDGVRRVVDVILNRVDSSKFPNSIYDVLYSPGQFSTIKKLDLDANIHVSETVNKAVEMELSVKQNERLDPESLYFARKPITQKGLYQFGDHYFSR